MMKKLIVAGALALSALGVSASQPMYPNPSALAERIAAKGAGAGHPRLKAAVRSETQLNVIDVLLVFDQSAVNWLARNNKGTSAQYAARCIEKLNYCLSQSRLTDYFHFRLAGALEISLDLATEPLFDVVLKMIDEYGRVVARGEWQRVTNKRGELGADIVSVLTASGSTGNVGQGFSLESDWGGRSGEAIKAFGDWAYNACSIEAVDEDYTLMHEIGHNMGCGHPDAEIAPGLAALSTWDSSMTGPQFYDYSSGWYLWDQGRGYYTIMGYNWGGLGPNGEYSDYLRFDALPIFSTPDFDWNGHALGDAWHDNRRTLINTYRYVAEYRISNLPSEDGPVVDPVDPGPVTPDPAPPTGNVVPVKASDVVGGFALAKAVELGGCLVDGNGVPSASVSFKIGKAGKKGTKVSGSVTTFATGKKATLKAQTVDLSRGPRTLSFEIKGQGAMSVKLGIDSKGQVVYSGTADGKTVTSAALGGESSATRQFSKPAVPAVVKGVTVKADYLPDGEPVRMQGKKWTLGKAASIAYKKDRATGAKRWFVNNDKLDPNKTNLSGLKLTYKAKDGSFKGSFTIYGLQNDKLKKIKADVRGVALDGKGYGVATVKNVAGATWQITIK